MSTAIQTTAGLAQGQRNPMPAAEPANPSAEHGISQEAVKGQLEKILSSPIFIRSRRLGRFLRFTIEQALEGRQATLKEYLVGVEVFNKLESFDPRIDSIVRVEARRLRSKLEHYYQTEGAEDPIVINFLKGSYVPVIMRRDQMSPAQRLPLTQAPARASISVAPFANLSTDAQDQFFASGLAEDLISSITKLQAYQVIARPTAFGTQGELRPDFALEGSVRRHGNRLRITAQLIDVEKGLYVWSDTYERETTDPLAVQDEIAQAIVSALTSRAPARAAA